MSYIVVNWDDGGSSVANSNKVVAPNGLQAGKEVKMQKGNVLWEGVVDSVWGKYPEAKRQLDVICPPPPPKQSFAIPLSGEKREKKPTRKINEAEPESGTMNEEEAELDEAKKPKTSAKGSTETKKKVKPTKSYKATQERQQKLMLQEQTHDLLSLVTQVSNEYAGEYADDETLENIAAERVDEVKAKQKIKMKSKELDSESDGQSKFGEMLSKRKKISKRFVEDTDSSDDEPSQKSKDLEVDLDNHGKFGETLPKKGKKSKDLDSDSDSDDDSNFGETMSKRGKKHKPSKSLFYDADKDDYGGTSKRAKLRLTDHDLNKIIDGVSLKVFSMLEKKFDTIGNDISAIKTLQEMRMKRRNITSHTDKENKENEDRNCTTPLSSPHTQSKTSSPMGVVGDSQDNKETSSLVFVGDPVYGIKSHPVKLSLAETQGKSRKNLALRLLDVLIAKDIQKKSTVFGSDKKIQLDGSIMSAIKSHCFNVFPSSTDDKDKWHNICSCITDKCRKTK